MSDVASNWERIRGELSSQAPSPIDVVAVTKGQPIERVKGAIEAGITQLGNNYVQDGEALLGALERELPAATVANLRWHFIGHIQSRKVRDLVGYYCIQSIDRLSLVEELNKRSGAQLPRVLIEVNIGNEGSKSGVAVETLGELLDQIDALGVSTHGIMVLPPPLFPVERRETYFEQARRLFDTHGRARQWQTLSMGTSDDYLVAVRCGATMIRLGTALFGTRTPKH